MTRGKWETWRRAAMAQAGRAQGLTRALTARRRDDPATPEASDARPAQTCLRRPTGPEDPAGPVLFP